jgi:Domain of unknown function (DUF5658)
MTTRRFILLALWLVLMTEADLLLTQVALAAGTARELDPVVVWLLGMHAYLAYIAYRLIVTALVIALLWGVQRSVGLVRWRGLATSLVIFIWTAPVAWNLGILGVEHVRHLI